MSDLLKPGLWEVRAATPQEKALNRHTKRWRIVSEEEFAKVIRRKLSGVQADCVMGPGRSGAIAAVYASHILNIPFIPQGQLVPAGLPRLLIIDTASETGKTLRKAQRRYPGSTAMAIYNEPPRVIFWYEAGGRKGRDMSLSQPAETRRPDVAASSSSPKERDTAAHGLLYVQNRRGGANPSAGSQMEGGMKRFVDLRDTDVDWNFAWFDTVTDTFEAHSGSMAWDHWGQFAVDYEGDELERYKGLTPEWVFKQGKAAE